jgi:hypothetical protein
MDLLAQRRAISKGASMNEQEAKHLAALIERESGAWIAVVGIAHNQVSDHYEVKCDDLERGCFLWVQTPRQWVALKYRQRGPHNSVAAL